MIGLHSLSDEELIVAVENDRHATHREHVLAERLALAHAYIAEVTVFLARNDLLEENKVVIQ